MTKNFSIRVILTGPGAMITASQHSQPVQLLISAGQLAAFSYCKVNHAVWYRHYEMLR
jgi:hypothetical protein